MEITNEKIKEIKAICLYGQKKKGEALMNEIWSDRDQLVKYMELLWKKATCPRLYVKEKGEPIVLKDCLLCINDPMAYDLYAEFLAQQKDIVKEHSRFMERYKSLIQCPMQEKEEAYISVYSYIFARNSRMHGLITGIFERYYENIIRYVNSPLAKTDNYNYRLTPSENKIYQMLICLMLASGDKPEIRNSLERIIIQKYPSLNQYITIYEKYRYEGSYMDAFFAPFLRAFEQAYSYYAFDGNMLECLIVLRELGLHYGYEQYKDDVLDICVIYYYEHLRENKLLPKSTGMRIRQSIEEIMAMKKKEYNMDIVYNTFDDFLYCTYYSIPLNNQRPYSEKAIFYLLEESQKNVNTLVREFLSSKYVREICRSNSPNMTPEDFVKAACDKAGAIVDDYLLFCKNPERAKTPNGTLEYQAAYELWSDFFGFTMERVLSNERRKELKSIHIEQKKKETVPKEKPSIEKRHIDTLEKRIQEKDKQLKISDMEVIRLQKEIAKLQNKLNEQAKDRKELISLREYIYETENSDVTLNTPSKKSTADMFREINNGIKGIIVGGHPNLLNKLAEALPDWKVYQSGMSIPDNVVAHADVVVMFTDHLSHASYIPVIKQVRNSKSRLLYLHNVNIDCVALKIHEQLSST